MTLSSREVKWCPHTCGAPQPEEPQTTLNSAERFACAFSMGSIPIGQGAISVQHLKEACAQCSVLKLKLIAVDAVCVLSIAIQLHKVHALGPLMCCQSDVVAVSVRLGFHRI